MDVLQDTRCELTTSSEGLGPNIVHKTYYEGTMTR
jgi:hypothetical protein